MSFISKLWKDRVSEYPTRRALTDETGEQSIVTVTREEGVISQTGDAFSAANMNDLETRIENAFEESNTALEQLRTQVDTDVAQQIQQIQTNFQQQVTQLNNSLTELEDGVKGTIICTSNVTTDNGKTIKLTNTQGGEWTKTIADKQAKFEKLPPIDKYHIQLKQGNNVEYETDRILNSGHYEEVEVGMDKTTWNGLKRIVKSGLASQMINIGDQITQRINGIDHVFDVVAIDYNAETYGHNIVMARHNCLPTTMQMQTSNTNANGYKATLIAKYLDGDFYNSFPDDMKAAITKMTFKASVGSQSQTLQNEEHYVWLPLNRNVFGADNYATASEYTGGGAKQFPYFATEANRIKTLDGSGSAVIWWEASPGASNGIGFCGVATSGAAYYYGSSGLFGVLPCFLIAED